MGLTWTKKIKGPFNTEVTVDFVAVLKVILVVGPLGALYRWHRPAMGLGYAIIDIVTAQRWATVFFGTTLVLSGLLLGAWPWIKQGWRSCIPAIAIGIGMVLMGLPLFADQLRSVSRWAGRSIGLVQFDNSSELREPIAKLVDDLREELGKSVEFTQIGVQAKGIVSALKQVQSYEHDVVVLDYEEPTQLGGVHFSDVLNPRTLYVLVRPADPNLTLPPNVISLSPAVVEEVSALATLVGSPPGQVRILRSGVPRARHAADLLRYALMTRGFAVDPVLTVSPKADLRDLHLDAGQTAVWIGWRRATLPDGSEIQGPSVIIVDESDGVVTQTIRPLPYQSCVVRDDVDWQQNQLLALKAIMDAHFVGEPGRPLDIRISIDKAVDLLASLHLVTVSHEMRLVPRYSQLGGPK